MDEQKKDESNQQEDVAQVGPYQLQEQMPQDEYCRGELYRATHETSGATTLVLKPSAQDEKGPVRRPGDWRVRFISSASPGYLALDVEHSPRSIAPDKHSVESLVWVQEESLVLEMWATDVHVDPVPVRAGEAPRPRSNQKRAPCTEGLEVEVSGACWLSVTQRPCPPQTVAYQGQCLLPVAVPRPPVTSLDGGSSEPR